MNVNERKLPNSDLLKTFIVIAECENLTHAADRLHRTQSAVSVQLRKLEEGLNVSLFERQARGMTLSENGKKLLPVARRALAEIQRTANLFDTPLAGRIRVGIPDDFDDTILEGVLADFSSRNPHVEVIASSGCTSGYAEAIGKGQLDVAVCSGPESVPGEFLSSEPTVWAGSIGFILNVETPLPLAILDRDCWWRDMPSKALEHQGRVWRVAYKSESFPSLRAAIRAGLAVGALPAGSVEPTMRVLSIENGLPPLPLSSRAILTRTDPPDDLMAAMAAAIRSAVLGRTPRNVQSMMARPL